MSSESKIKTKLILEISGRNAHSKAESHDFNGNVVIESYPPGADRPDYHIVKVTGDDHGEIKVGDNKVKFYHSSNFTEKGHPTVVELNPFTTPHGQYGNSGSADLNDAENMRTLRSLIGGIKVRATRTTT